MSYCAKCGAKIGPVEANFCDKCGNPINTTFIKGVLPIIAEKRVGSPKDDQNREAKNKKAIRILLTIIGAPIALIVLKGVGLLTLPAILIVCFLVIEAITGFRLSKMVYKAINNLFSHIDPFKRILLITGAIVLCVFIIILLIPTDKEKGNKYLAEKQWDKAIEYFGNDDDPYSPTELNYALAAKAYSQGKLKSSFQYINKALSASFGFNPPHYHDITNLRDSIQYYLDKDSLSFLLRQLKYVIKQSSDTSNLLIGRICSLKNFDKLSLSLSPNGNAIWNLCVSLKRLNEIYPMFDDLMKDSINNVESVLQSKKEKLDEMLVRRFTIKAQFDKDPGSGKGVYEVTDMSTYDLAVVIASPDEIPESLWGKMNVALTVKRRGNQPMTYNDGSTKYVPTFETINQNIVLALSNGYRSLKSGLASMKESRKSGPAQIRQNIERTQSELMKEFVVLCESNNF